MSVRYPGRAEIDPFAPQALGICDRCGLQYNLRALRWQFAWAGRELINKRIRVCDTCWDIPNEQLRSIRLPPDPDPVFDARPENFAVDEKNFITIVPPVARQTIFDTVPAAAFVTILGAGQVEIIAAVTGAATRPATSLGLITFTASAAGSGDIGFVATYDAATGGNLLAFAAVPPKSVIAGDSLTIPAGKLAGALT